MKYRGIYRWLQRLCSSQTHRCQSTWIVNMGIYEPRSLSEYIGQNILGSSRIQLEFKKKRNLILHVTKRRWKETPRGNSLWICWIRASLKFKDPVRVQKQETKSKSYVAKDQYCGEHIKKDHDEHCSRIVFSSPEYWISIHINRKFTSISL